MKKLFVLFLLVQSSLLLPQDVIVKSLKTYTSSDSKSIPVLSTPRDVLIIDFDVQSDYPPNINIIFKFCDRNWKPVDNIFLSNQGKNTAYSLDYFSLPTTVEEAKYHYNNSFPDKNGYVSFPFSGKWKYYIVDSQDPSIVFAEDKFVVVKADVPLRVETKRETLDDKTYFPPQLGHSNWVIVDAAPKENYFTFQVDEIEIIQNHLVENTIKVSRNSTDQNRAFEWDGASKLRFTAKDVRPGNEYRQANLQDINIYNSKNVKAQFDGMEYSRFLLLSPNDNNGSFILKAPKDMYATYMNVLFQVKPPAEVYGDVYLVGAFNGWKLSDNNKMNFNGDHFELTVELKRGVYDYQYVVVNGEYSDVTNQDWFVLEGNDWQTTNDLNIFLWYRDQENGGYDRIIGYSKIQTR
ncbi:MAG: type IX secretion system plug protein domain-containing protein [Ignavibacteriaceae bacterium]